MRIGIIGNGVLGTTLAYRLSKHLSGSLSQVFIFGEPARPNAGSTAAAAMMNSFAEFEDSTYQDSIDEKKFLLSQQAAKMWGDFINELTLETKFSQLSSSYKTGTFIINNSSTDSLDDKNFDAIVDALKKYDEPFEYVTPSSIPNYLPTEAARAQRALYIPNEGWVNPKLLLKTLDLYLENSKSAMLIDKKILSFSVLSDGRISIAATDGTKYDFDYVVIANGAEMNNLQLREQLGLNVQKLFYGVGTTVEIESEFQHTNCVRTPNRGLACGIYSAPYLNSDSLKNNIIVGASNFISHEPQYFSRLTSVKSLLAAAEEQINKNFYRANLVGINVGWRPTSQDTYPLIGRTSIKNLFILNGTKRDGVHFSPLISENIAQQILKDSTPDIFSDFSPERDLIKKGSREEGIEQAIQHRRSGLYQHGYRPSTERLNELIVSAWEQDLNRLYDDAKIFDFAIPVEMLDMYRFKHALIQK
jgi:glycine oxidase